MSRALVINLGWEQQPLLARVHEDGHEIYGVHYDSDYERAVPFADVHVTELRDLDSILAYARKVRPGLVISDQCDYSQFAQAVVAESLGLPGPSVEDAQISCNKLLQREKSLRKGIDIPVFRLCTRLAEAEEAMAEIGLPVILKPVDNRGSFGVNKVSSAGELGEAFWDALANSHSRYILVEEFVEGAHITVDGYAFPQAGCRSLALATKGLLPDSERQVAVDILYPGELEEEVYDRAMKVNEEVNTKLGYRFGMTHSEYMLTADGRTVLIESANRGGGCYTSELIVPQASGIDLLSQYVGDAAGKAEDRYREPERNPVILKFVTFAPGRIESIEGGGDAAGEEGVLALRLQVSEGETIAPVSTDANRHGFIIFKAEDRVREGAEAVLSKVQIKYGN